MISGYATKSGTANYFKAFPTVQTNTINDLTCAQAGFGSYRTVLNDVVHQQALAQSLRSGINLIDTSSNYGDGASEELIGSVIGDQIAAGRLSRDQIIVVTKGGYLQGENYAISQARTAEGKPWLDLVRYSQGLEHCIHPEFLKDQLDRSLSRLGLETADVFLLHNPEYFLGWAKKADIEVAEARAEYYQRIKQAFKYLETEVKSGRIKRYGISSNSFPNYPDSYDFTSLEKVLEVAESVSADHHFKVIQFPMNLLETGPATAINQSNGRTLLDLAHEKGLMTLINRPLNGVVGNNLIRLAKLPMVKGNPDPDEAEGWIEKLTEIEGRLQQAMFSIPDEKVPFRTKQEFAATTAGGRLLKQRWEGFGTFSNWKDIRSGYLEPRANFAIQFLNNRPELPQEAVPWILEYKEILENTLDTISAVYRAQEAGMLTTIKMNSETADDAWRGGKTLSQTAVRALRSTAGVSCVLVGMRQSKYVDDVLTEISQPIEIKKRPMSWANLAKQI